MEECFLSTFNGCSVEEIVRTTNDADCSEDAYLICDDNGGGAVEVNDDGGNNSFVPRTSSQEALLYFHCT
jgi:hypothetical protein